MKFRQFDRNNVCRDCGFLLHQHTKTIAYGEKGTEYTLHHCPDPSLPDTGRDDDPWEEDFTEGRSDIPALFDRYT